MGITFWKGPGLKSHQTLCYKRAWIKFAASEAVVIFCYQWWAEIEIDLPEGCHVMLNIDE